MKNDRILSRQVWARFQSPELDLSFPTIILRVGQPSPCVPRPNPLGPRKARFHATAGGGGPALAAALGLGRSEQGRVARVPSPLAAQSPRARGAPGGWGSGRNVARLRRCASAGPGRRARSVWRRRRCADRQTCRERSTARNSAARAAPAHPPWCRGSSPGWWCKWPLFLRPFFPFLQVSRSLRATRPCEPPAPGS